MNFTVDDPLRDLIEAGRVLGTRCRAQTPAQVGEDWRGAGAKELLRTSGAGGMAAFLDAYACARGTLRAARVHAADAIAKTPMVAEAALLAAGVEGLVLEVVENVRLPAELRGAEFPGEKDPAVRRALADARTLSLIARNLAYRAGWVVDAGTPVLEVASLPAFALSAACDAVLASWPPLSRLVRVEETYQRYETELFRIAASRKPGIRAAIAALLVGAPATKSETTVTVSEGAA